MIINLFAIPYGIAELNMNKDYKAKLLEKAGIYVDCCQLLKCVYKLLFSMPKKDRVIIGDKIIEYNLSMIAHFSKGFQFKECRH